ncbi:hypothetical protein L208DRAFT_1523461 [Tricholoma matsutake]|nr:hypothetical protein L208DRAFT_1523461 [Tricholoma matsutake 945]
MPFGICFDWFSTFTHHPDPYHQQFRISPSKAPDGGNLASIVPVTSIVSSLHLLPQFGPICDRSWTSSNVLDHCQGFFINSFGDHDHDIHSLINSYNHVIR